MEESERISTGSFDFNDFLGGGYERGVVTMLVGGPGSGKTTVASELFGIPNKLSFSVNGLKVFNSDREFEYLLKKNNLSADLTQLNDEEL